MLDPTDPTDLDFGQAILSSSLFPWQRTFDRPEAAERLRSVSALGGGRTSGGSVLASCPRSMGLGMQVLSDGV